MTNGPAFRAGLHVSRAEFRSTDTAGRPVDPLTETPTARDERVRALQDQRLASGGRMAPATNPADVVTEWMAASPHNRMSAFALAIAEDPARLPQVELEPRPGESPRPGGLLAGMAALRRRRGSAG